MTNAISKTSIRTYRSLKNTLAFATEFNDLEEGRATLVINISDNISISDTSRDDGCSLNLKGSIQYGSPATLRFQGPGNVDQEPWIYEDLFYQVPLISNGEFQIPTLVRSPTRAIKHKGTNGERVAGAVYSCYALLQPQS